MLGAFILLPCFILRLSLDHHLNSSLNFYTTLHSYLSSFILVLVPGAFLVMSDTWYFPFVAASVSVSWFFSRFFVFSGFFFLLLSFFALCSVSAHSAIFLISSRQVTLWYSLVARKNSDHIFVLSLFLYAAPFVCAFRFFYRAYFRPNWCFKCRQTCFRLCFPAYFFSIHIAFACRSLSELSSIFPCCFSYLIIQFLKFAS